jgi:LuxR family maltose regulon positive regulatory protein
MVTTRPNAQSYIIKRPRLTKLLDETEARIILLCAPAGYGKTTLAREWASGRPSHALWYAGSGELLDWAAIRHAMFNLLDSRGLLGGSRLSHEPTSSTSPGGAGQALGASVSASAETILVIDDYHHASDAKASNEFLAAFVQALPLRCVITSRTRPPWISARTEIYGEAIILGPKELAFTADEEREVLGLRKDPKKSRLLERAEGWPAVVGLAARREEALNHNRELPSDLFEFLAQDVFSAASASVRRSLYLMALAQTADKGVLDRLLGERCEDVTTATDLGLVARGSDGEIGLHPLIHDFLVARLRASDEVEALHLVALAVSALSDAGRWEECLQTLSEFPHRELLVEALTRALPELAQTGRVASLARWVDGAKSLGADEPIVVLADAEVAYRSGDAVRALALGSHASEMFVEGEHAARAHLIAAMAAQMLSDKATSEHHAARASDLSAENSTRTAARWLQLLRHVEQGEVDAARSLAREFGLSPAATASEALRAHNAQAFVEFEVNGDVCAAGDALARGVGLLPYVPDPLQRTNFLNLRGAVLLYMSSYDQAQEAAERLIEEAEAHELAFVVDHALLTRAGAEIGLRQFSMARRSLAALERRASISGFIQVQLALKTALLRLGTGDLRRAEITLRGDPPFELARALPGEWLGIRALIRAGAGKLAEASEDIIEARKSLPYLDARDFAGLAEAIVWTRTGSETDERSAAAVARVMSTGHRDAVVHAARAYPGLITAAVRADRSLEAELTRLLAESRDVTVGRAAGLEMPREQRRPEGLSPRESEVYELLIQGRTNPEIAATLFIANSTVKVHVRHIYEKLRVHSRAEAAAVRGRRRSGERDDGGVA